MLERVRDALGGRDYRAEVAGYALALQGAAPQQVLVITDRLLDLAHSPAGIDALAALVGLALKLDPARHDRMLVVGHGRFGKAIGQTVLNTNPEARQAAASTIGRIVDPDSMVWLSGLLADQDEKVALRASHALLRLSKRVFEAPDLDWSTRSAIEQTVVKAVDTFDKHRRREALVALLTLLNSPAMFKAASEACRAFLSDSEHPAHMVLRSMLRRGDAVLEPKLGRSAAFACLASRELTSACIDRLSTAADADAHEHILSQGHLLQHPLRAYALRMAARRTKPSKAPGLHVPVASLDQMAPQAAAWVTRWQGLVAAITPDYLEPLMARPEVDLRWRAMLAAESIASDMLLDMCFDTDPRLARGAALRIGLPRHRVSFSPDVQTRVNSALRRSEHMGVRKLADAQVGLFDALGSESGRLAARRLYAADPAKLVRAIQSQIRDGTPARRQAAIRLAIDFRLGPGIELELLAIVAASIEAADRLNVAALEGDPQGDTHAVHVVRAAAMAVGVLAQLESPAAQHAVHRCLRHPDIRVRANTLDAMARVARRRGSIVDRDTPMSGAIIEFKSSEHHRLRASAMHTELLAAARSGAGSALLAAHVRPLLIDSRPMHRLSGLWLAERAIGQHVQAQDALASELAAPIADIVRAERDLSIRTRARRVAATLLSGPQS